MVYHIWHLGKAGEVLCGLPMAQVIKAMEPKCRVIWHVLEPYRDSLGDSPFIDELITLPIQIEKGLEGISEEMRKIRGTQFNFEQVVRNREDVHINAYYRYVISRSRKVSGGEISHDVERDPFYLQFFKNAFVDHPDQYSADLWAPPQWFPSVSQCNEAEDFLSKYCGGKSVIVVSPFVADKDCKADNKGSADWESIHTKLLDFEKPLIYTGTQWDAKYLPQGAIDGYAPELSLGALLYIIKYRCDFIVSLNSGVGFAAHWLGCPVIMIDNRIAWPEQIRQWRIAFPNFSGHPLEGEVQWPMFQVSKFPREHLLAVPFNQIVWSEEIFSKALDHLSKYLKPRNGMVAQPNQSVRQIPHSTNARIRSLQRWMEDIRKTISVL